MALHKIIDGVKVVCSDEEEKEIRARWKANDKNAKQNGYIIDRVGSYPPIGDQLDMLWHAMDLGEIPKCEAFYSAIAEVKNKYPKA